MAIGGTEILMQSRRSFLLVLMASAATIPIIGAKIEVKVRYIDCGLQTDETYYRFMYVHPKWLESMSEIKHAS